MSTWQITVLFAIMAGCAIGCLFGIYRAMEKLARALFSIGAELTKMSTKIEKIETVNGDYPTKTMDQYGPDPSLEDIEAAISKFEKLKRIDLTKP